MSTELADEPLFRDAHRSLVDSADRPLFIPRYRLYGGDLFPRLPPLYLRACRFFASPLIDRTATLDDGIGYRILEPLTATTPGPASFAERCDARAEALLTRAIASDRRIELLWSGGIDSSSALVALLRAAERHDALERLRVVLTEGSKAEFPSLFEGLITPRLAWRQFEPPLYQELDPGCITVTGEHGDQLFGSDKLAEPMAEGYAFAPWGDTLPRLIASRLPNEREPEALIRYLEPQLAKAPRPLVSLWDLLWWLNYSLKWQYVALRLLCNASAEGVSPFRLEGNLVNFFSTPAFQAWALHPHEMKVRADWASYKYPAKAYIHAYHADAVYQEQKLKEPSLNQAIRGVGFPFLEALEEGDDE